MTLEMRFWNKVNRASEQANGRAKLTPEQVHAIRLDKRGKRTIAKDYGISPAQAQRIRNGQQWSAI